VKVFFIGIPTEGQSTVKSVKLNVTILHGYATVDRQYLRIDAKSSVGGKLKLTLTLTV